MNQQFVPNQYLNPGERRGKFADERRRREGGREAAPPLSWGGGGRAGVCNLQVGGLSPSLQLHLARGGGAAQGGVSAQPQAAQMVHHKLIRGGAASAAG